MRIFGNMKQQTENQKEIPIRAGLIPYYYDENKNVYLNLIQTHRGTIEFSKGHIDWTEDEKQCALREAYEELGYKYKSEHKIRTACICNKIQFFMVEVTKQEVNAWKRPTWKQEIQNTVWLNIGDVTEKLIDWQREAFGRFLLKINV